MFHRCSWLTGGMVVEPRSRKTLFSIMSRQSLISSQWGCQLKNTSWNNVAFQIIHRQMKGTLHVCSSFFFQHPPCWTIWWPHWLVWISLINNDSIKVKSNQKTLQMFYQNQAAFRGVEHKFVNIRFKHWLTFTVYKTNDCSIPSMHCLRVWSKSNITLCEHKIKPSPANRNYLVIEPHISNIVILELQNFFHNNY